MIDENEEFPFHNFRGSNAAFWIELLRRLFIWKVPADDRDATQTRHLTTIKDGLLLFKDLMSEVISCLVPT